MAGSGCLKDVRIKESLVAVTYFKNLKRTCGFHERIGSYLVPVL
jgi:hypothetical protein